jgi:hypothetical protein
MDAAARKSSGRVYTLESCPQERLRTESAQGRGMTRLGRLTVSLTKHGAHKIALLLQKYDANSILQHLEGSEPGVNIELAQAKKNLSISADGNIPEVWNKARALGPDVINALVLVSIIFSHVHLIDMVRRADNRNGFSGTIRRERMQNEKAFTNFAHTFDELGYSVEHTSDHVRYDFRKFFDITGLNMLVEELLTLKLIDAQWDQKNSLVEEAIKLNFHEVFSLTAAEFKKWLEGEGRDVVKAKANLKDAQYFFAADDATSTEKFQFKAGHNQKKIGEIPKDISPERRFVILKHNAIQNKLYEALCAKFGAECVGTEVPTGDGTSIDVVVKTKEFCWFYEIKTDATAKGSIRQAIPQLLEYAYWQCENHVDKLIIVSPAAITAEATRYLSFLNASFNLRFCYEQVGA